MATCRLVDLYLIISGAGQLLDLFRVWPGCGAAQSLLSIAIALHSLTLFLPRRLLFGWLSRRGTIAAAIFFILLAAATCIFALLNYAAAFL